MLPLRDGFAVCKDIRDAGGTLPILFLTAKNSPEDRIRGLEVGGDDYLGKPFHLRELLMRVQAMLRRQEWYGKAPSAGPSFRLAGTTVDFRTYEVKDADGRTEILPQKEVMILKLLVERAGEVVSRDDILNQVWGYDVYPSSRTVDNFIVRLRRRFEPDAAEPRYFHTIRGVGYKFTPDP
jgi:two-component system alkaline phosphatase synthesis response regulator PhoP